MLKAGTLELETSQRMSDILGVIGDKHIGALESVQQFSEKLRKALADGGGIPEEADESVSDELSDDNASESAEGSSQESEQNDT